MDIKREKDMAKIEGFTPFLKKWEGGYVCDPDDLGGATNMGVTIETYRAYCRKKPELHRKNISIATLKKLNDETWMDIVKTLYWDKFRGDDIQSQSVANMCVDWLWNSGTVAIKRVQEIVGVKVDGIVGDKTIAAINNRSPLPLFGAIKEARKEYIEEICVKRPKNEKFRKGWMNRINDLMFEE